METNTLLWILIVIIYLGFGFVCISTFELLWTKGDPKSPEAPPGIARFFLFILWPTLLISYLIFGFSGRSKKS